MIPVNGIERFTGDERARDHFEFFHVLASALASAEILLELPRVHRGQHDQIPSALNISSALSQTIRSRPASVASKVLFVVAVGMATSNGSPSRSST